MTTTSSTTSSTATTTAATTTTSSTSSAASIGQSILTSLNANGASIDTNSLVTNLTAAQKSSIEDPITAKQATNTAQISSAATLASDISTFSQIMTTLVSGGTLQTQPSSSNAGVMTVAAIAGTPVGSLSSSIQVKTLAQAQTVQSNAYGSTATFNAGTINLTVTGGTTPTTVPVTITANSSLSDVAKAINAQATGYTASVVATSSGNTLVIKGATGAAQAFTLSSQASGSDSSTATTNSLAALYSGTGATGDLTAAQQSFTAAQSATDADLVVDGVEVTRSSNSFSDVVPGVQMNLVSTGTITLGSTRPTAAITQAITDLVANYNSILTDINTATAAATTSADAGPLRGNAAIRSLKTQLSKITTTPLNASGSIRTLAELGVKTAQDGTLSVDSTTLSNMLTKYPDDVESMFMSTQSSSSSRVNITSTTGSVASGVYSVTGIADTDTSGTGNATGSINGAAMTASSWTLTSNAANGVSGLSLQILSGAPTSATITINQGLNGVLALLNTQLTGKAGELTTLQTALATQKTTLADALTKADTQVTTYHDQLVTKFTQMNTLVSGYKSTAAYLTQQTDLWTKSSN